MDSHYPIQYQPYVVKNVFAQSYFLSEPKFTEANLEDQSGKVHMVTGGYAGVGEELSKIFYSKNATVYIAGRSAEKAEAAILRIKAAFPDSTGHLEFLELDLSDLTTIKPAVEKFKSLESKLHTLTNNAGVMNTPTKAKSKQGFELQLGTNCVGPWLLTHHLLPVLQETAKSAPKNSVRVTWASSLTAVYAPKNGVILNSTRMGHNLGAPKIHPFKEINYAQSKALNILLATEFAHRYGDAKGDAGGILSVSFNPGNLRTELQRHTGKVQAFLMDKMLVHPPKFGAYTELYAACSPDIRIERGGNGCFIAPWGRIHDIRKDIMDATRGENWGGTGTAKKFWDWCERQCEPYL